jgi:hypothetical protein
MGRPGSVSQVDHTSLLATILRRFLRPARRERSKGEHAITSRAIDTDGHVQPAADVPLIVGKHTCLESNQQITRRVAVA